MYRYSCFFAEKTSIIVVLLVTTLLVLSSSCEDGGALRAQHGHEQPFAIRYWELGNETHFCFNPCVRNGEPWTLTCEEYVERINAYVPAMKESDPTIEVMAYVNPFTYAMLDEFELAGTAVADIRCGDLDPNGEFAGLTWSRAIIEGAGENLDYLYLHYEQ